MELRDFEKKHEEKCNSIKQETRELIQLISLEAISFPGHFKPWLVAHLKEGHYCEHWGRTEELIKLCRVAILKKDWKPVRSFLYKCSDEDRKKRDWIAAERKKLGLPNYYSIEK